ncbi:MAG: hypothetical protein V4685_04355 [Bacteroidota bacterium]
MKTLLNIIIAASFTLTVSNTKAQAGYNDEPVTAETLLQMQENGNGLFAISPIKIESIVNGFTIQWQTINEKNIASFELEAGEDKKSFTSVKKMEAGNDDRPANIYQIGLKSPAIQGDKIYLRIKINFNDGTSRYTNESVLKMRKTK